MNVLNEAANNRPRSALIHSIQQENRHIRQLQQVRAGSTMGWTFLLYQLIVPLTLAVYMLWLRQYFLFTNFSSNFSLLQENKELRLALEEHQNVMELIMSKYRQQVAKLVTVNAKQTQPTSQDQAMVRDLYLLLLVLFFCSVTKLFYIFSEIVYIADEN